MSASPLASPRDRHTRKAPPPPPDSPRLGDASKYGSVDWPSAEAALTSQLKLPPTLAWMARLALAPPARFTWRRRAWHTHARRRFADACAAKRAAKRAAGGWRERRTVRLGLSRLSH